MKSKIVLFAGVLGLAVPCAADVTVREPLSSVEVVIPGADAAGGFELFGDKAVFRQAGSPEVRIPAGTRGFSVYGGQVDYFEGDDGRMRFSYYGPREALRLSVQGRVFTLARGGRLGASRSNVTGEWTYSTVGGESGGEPVSSMLVKPVASSVPVLFSQGGAPEGGLPSGGSGVPFFDSGPGVVVPFLRLTGTAGAGLPAPSGGSGPAVSSGDAGLSAAAEVSGTRVLGLFRDGNFQSGLKSVDAVDAKSKAAVDVTQEGLRKRLRAQPAEELVLHGLTLEEAFVFLGRRSGISFVLIDGAVKSLVKGGGKITSRVRDNPFHFLELLAFEQGCMVVPLGVSEEYPDGIWTLKSMEQEGLIGRTYRLRYAYGSASGFSGGGKGFGAGQPGSSSALNPRHAMQFQSDGSKIMGELQGLLDLIERGLVIDGETDYTKTDVELNRQIDELGVPSYRGLKVEGPKARVLFSDLTGVLFVVASRAQHEWVRGYLRAIDRPSRNVFLEVKFVETSKSPSDAYGIKWPSELRVAVTGRNLIGQATNGQVTGQTTTEQNVWEAGSTLAGYDRTGVGIPFKGGFPLTGLIKATDLEMVLSALKEDSSGSNIQYFYTLVSENREVLMKNTAQQPIMSASSSVTNGGSGTVSQQVEYRDIGLIMNVKPRVVGVNDIYLDMSFELSKIVGRELIGGLPYPIPGMRSIQIPVTISSGNSMAIGGLDEFRHDVQESRVPVLGSLPLVGRLFRHTATQKPRSHLLIFVTARVQDGYVEGVDHQRRGVFLGDWRGYYGGAVSMPALKEMCNGLWTQVSRLEQSMHSSVLTPADLGDVNALRGDLARVFKDYESLAGVSGEDEVFFAQLKDWERRVNQVWALLSKGAS
jgi:general secretion pathway protein D